MTREELREAVDSFGRKLMCDKLGMPYSTLSAKMNGYIPTTDAEAEKMQEIMGGKDADDQNSADS